VACRPDRSRAFLVPAPAMAARITRAKKALAYANVPFEVPVGTELAARLASVLEAVYLIFNEGYAATSGDSWTRAELCEEAMHLGRMLAALAPDEPEDIRPVRGGGGRSGRRVRSAKASGSVAQPVRGRV